MNCKQNIYVGKKSQKEACLISNSKILESSVNTWKTLFDFIKETIQFSFTFPLLYKVTFNHSPICAPFAIEVDFNDTS